MSFFVIQFKKKHRPLSTSKWLVSLFQIGIFVLSTVSKVAPEALGPHIGAMLSLCSNSLDDRQSTDIPLHTIQ